MRQTELKLQFPTEKLDALRFFIAKKDLDIEQELKDYLDKTYERLVPANVREYLESRIEQEPVLEQESEQQVQEAVPEAQQQAQPEQESRLQPQRQPRQTRRQREQNATETATPQQVVQQEQGGEPEETQGMTMSM